ncbi:hypothetical protein Acr_28g0005770 [Actinidia rufa]|uniref:Uncharacterized protein n=1 Tax=Actinidia rufa TaxID=165716 RepID=A0A7J0H9S8_9ERIC|nr:hypothetical protein Acr_28g0005770 [Actinidia rufa]
MADKVNQHPSPLEESSPRERLPKIKVSSYPATELNIMTQGDLDRLRETCSFPLGVRTRIPKNGGTVLSSGDGEVAFYKAVSLAGLRCLYALLKGPRSELGWLYFKVRLGKNIPKGGPSNVKGWKKRFFFISGDYWEFHPSIPRKGGGSIGSKVMGHSGGTAEVDIGGEAEGNIRGGAATSTGDTSESSQSKDVPRPEVLSRDDSVKFIGIIGKEMRRILPYVPDLNLLRWSGEKVRDHFLGPAPNSSSSSSDSRLGSRSDSRLSPELRSDVISKRIKLSQLAKVVAKKIATSSSKASEMASKKGALNDGEGSTAKFVPGEALGPHASVMSNAATVEKILAGVILPADKEKVEKLTFDQVLTKFIHVIGQVFVFFPRAGDGLSSKLGYQIRGGLAEVSAKRKKIVEEVEVKNKEVARLEVQVGKLEKSQNLAKARIIAAFKELNDFQEAVIGSASFYFGDSFDFCKRQLALHYPNLSIDLEDIERDRDFLAKEEAEAEERERKATEERGEKEAEVEEGEKGD